MNRLDALTMSHPLPTWRIAAWPIVMLIVAFLAWANFAHLEEVAVATGEVVPQGKVRVIQHLEGGIVERIYVREGDMIREGSPVIQLNLATGGVNRNELLVRLDAQNLIKARLEAQAKEIPLTFPEDIAPRHPAMVEAQRKTYDAALRELESSLKVFEQQKLQKGLEVKELESKRGNLQTRRNEITSSAGALRQQVRQKELEVQELESKRRSTATNLNLARERFKMSQSLVSQGLVPKMEHLKLEAEVQSLEGDLNNLDSSIPRARAAVGEAEGKLKIDLESVDGDLRNLEASIPRALAAVNEIEQKTQGEKSKFRRTAEEALGETEQAIARIGTLLAEATEQKGRSEIKSPIDGVVKNLRYNTIGGVVRPGDPIMEIVPTAESLVIDARLNPTDRGYVEEGQKAVVKISTYDFVRYGGLDGQVILVAPDSSTDKSGNIYFQVIVKTDKIYLGDAEGKLPITPGMQATVDIRTGQKSVIDYLVKPVLKLRHEAFRDP